MNAGQWWSFFNQSYWHAAPPALRLRALLPRFRPATSRRRRRHNLDKNSCLLRHSAPGAVGSSWPGQGCAWRVVSSPRVANSSCVLDKVYSSIEVSSRGRRHRRHAP